MPSEFNRPFGRLSPCGGQVAYALLTRPPLAANVLLHPAAARLACVRPAASVYPEPGSNSSLYKIFIFLLDVGFSCSLFLRLVLAVKNYSQISSANFCQLNRVFQSETTMQSYEHFSVSSKSF